MTDWCGYCRKAREYLHSLGVNLIEYDIEKDKGKREEMHKRGGKGVPLIDVEGILIKGYSPDLIKGAIEKKKVTLRHSLMSPAVCLFVLDYPSE